MEKVQNLSPTKIVGEVYYVTPAVIERIAKIFADGVADAMKMRTFAPKIRQIAEDSLRMGLKSVKHSGAKHC
ncbi:MAG: hypothetical protein MJ187_01225 [Alphaproteobacteria bacterium]|nr:hypothetical protein [Alphaproteobacteria bacterium]